MGHSHIGGSSAKRFIECPGSVRLIKQIPRKPPGEYAEEGTAAHDLGEHRLRESNGLTTGSYSKLLNKWYSGEMEEFVRIYYDAVMKVLNGGPARKLFIEQKFNLKWLHKDLYGRNDACVAEAFGILDIFDLKYGRGVVVEAENNYQMMYYALGALRMVCLDVTHVRMTIVQPRAHHPKGPVRSWMITIQELLGWGENILKPAAYATEDPKAPLNPGTHCKEYFCPAMATCPAMKDHAYAVAKQEFDVLPEEVTFPDTELLSPVDIAKVLQFSPLLKDYIEKVNAHAFDLLKKGETVPGFKLVAKKVNRKYKDAEEMEKVLKQEYGGKIFSPASLLGIGKMEKLIGKKRMTEFTCKPPAGLTIASESDARPAVTNSVESEFDKIPIEEEK